MCPVGDMGAIQMDSPPRWHCATEALSLAYAYDGLLTEETACSHLEGEDGPKIGGIGPGHPVGSVYATFKYGAPQRGFCANPRSASVILIDPRLSKRTAVRAVGSWSRHALTPHPWRTARIAARAPS